MPNVVEKREQLPRASLKAERSLLWMWMAALTLLTLLFFGTFFNRFAGMRSGNGEFTTGIWLLRGQLPYRDYFSATPPLNTIKAALLLKIFGPFLIVNRLTGVAERVLIALVLFHWLRRLFAVRFAFTASLVTILLSAGDLVDPVASYNHDAILWALLSGLTASFVLDDEIHTCVLLWSALSGLFAGLCLITKQTTGVGAAIAVPFVVSMLLVNSGTYRKACVWVMSFYTGCGVPILLLALWLHRLHAWRLFLLMAFLKGPAAKGGNPEDFLRRALLVAESNWILVLLAMASIGFASGAVRRSQADQEAHTKESIDHGPAKPALLFGSLIIGAKLLSLTGLGTIHNLSKTAVYFVLIATALLLAWYSVVLCGRVLTPRQRQFALFAAVSFFIAFFFSLSWPAFEAMSLPGLGFLTAALLDGTRPNHRRYVYVVLGCLVFVQTCEKLDLPFGFDGLNEAPVRFAVQPSSVLELRGMRFSPEMNLFINGTLDNILKNSTSHDTIFTYPEMSLFYALSGRNYPTLSGSHNVDVVNDTFAAEEAIRILEQRPAVVIYMKLTPEEVAHQDLIWRFGKPSGQHRLVQAVEQLVRTYRVAAVYKVDQQARPIVVYVRREHSAAEFDVER